jgi:hypothetical protein
VQNLAPIGWTEKNGSDAELRADGYAEKIAPMR